MGRTLPSATQVFFQEEAAYHAYKRALSLTDQRALEALFDYAHWHIAEMGYAAHPLPMQIILLAMLLEQQKELRRLRDLIARLEQGQAVDLGELRSLGELRPLGELRSLGELQTSSELRPQPARQNDRTGGQGKLF